LELSLGQLLETILAFGMRRLRDFGAFGALDTKTAVQIRAGESQRGNARGFYSELRVSLTAGAAMILLTAERFKLGGTALLGAERPLRGYPEGTIEHRQFVA